MNSAGERRHRQLLSPLDTIGRFSRCAPLREQVPRLRGAKTILRGPASNYSSHAFLVTGHLFLGFCNTHASPVRMNRANIIRFEPNLASRSTPRRVLQASVADSRLRLHALVITYETAKQRRAAARLSRFQAPPLIFSKTFLRGRSRIHCDS